MAVAPSPASTAARKFQLWAQRTGIGAEPREGFLED